MPGAFRENWKRLSGQLAPKGPTAMEDLDIVRVEDLGPLIATVTGVPLWRVTNVTTPTPYVAQSTDDLIIIDVSGSYDVILPDNASIGKRYEIKDGAGDGCLGGVSKRIVASGTNTIEGIFTDFPLSNCYQSWSLIFGVDDKWRLV